METRSRSFESGTWAIYWFGHYKAGDQYYTLDKALYLYLIVTVKFMRYTHLNYFIHILIVHAILLLCEQFLIAPTRLILNWPQCDVVYCSSISIAQLSGKISHCPVDSKRCGCNIRLPERLEGVTGTWFVGWRNVLVWSCQQTVSWGEPAPDASEASLCRNKANRNVYVNDTLLLLWYLWWPNFNNAEEDCRGESSVEKLH